MSTATEMHSDHDIQAAVQSELDWTPDVDAAGIGVAVEDGTVTLSGEVDDNSERLAAVRAAHRVRGVSTVVDGLIVHPEVAFPLTETDIAREVEHALASATNVPNAIKADIKGHDVTLTGQVQWDFQRRAAKTAVDHLRGVHRVDNQITLSMRPSVIDAKARITSALTRNAQVDANHITVDIEGTKVTLTGHVRSWAEKEQARFAAWSSPHVTDVDDRLVVRSA